jgi:hypothetical protein
MKQIIAALTLAIIATASTTSAQPTPTVLGGTNLRVGTATGVVGSLLFLGLFVGGSDGTTTTTTTTTGSGS